MGQLVLVVNLTDQGRSLTWIASIRLACERVCEGIFLGANSYSRDKQCPFLVPASVAFSSLPSHPSLSWLSLPMDYDLEI